MAEIPRSSPTDEPIDDWHKVTLSDAPRPTPWRRRGERAWCGRCTAWVPVVGRSGACLTCQHPAGTCSHCLLEGEAQRQLRPVHYSPEVDEPARLTRRRWGRFGRILRRQNNNRAGDDGA